MFIRTNKNILNPKGDDNNTTKKTGITRGAKTLIKEVVEATGSNNREELCFAISEVLVKRFPGKALSYQLERMRLETTKQILAAIDEYFFYYINKTSKKKTS